MATDLAIPSAPGTMRTHPSPLGIRVMLVDDHPVMRVGLANVLSLNHGFAVVAQADDGPSAIALWRQHHPDVCLLDVSMERMDGIETLRRLRADFPEARVIMLTSSKAAEDREMAMQSGACGYLLKTVRHDELAAAIRRVHAGETLAGPPPPASPLPRRGPLTQREIEVLGFIRQGFSNDEIARLMGISERTVRAHITSILASLQAADRAQAVALGFELGILKLPSRA